MQRDSELLCRYVEHGSDVAFGEIVERYLPLVYGAALRQLGGDAHEARDVAQSVFTALARKARTLVQRPELVTWLYTSTRFAAAKVRRARARRQKYESSAEIMNSLHDESSTTADWERLGPLVDDALHELSERDRTLVLLRFFSNRPFAEIGAVQGLSVDAARMRVERALDKLRHALLRRGIASTSAALASVLVTQASAAVPAGIAATITQAALVNGSAVVMGGTIGSATIFQIMSTTKFILGSLSVVAVIAIGTAWREAGTLSDTRLALTAAERQRTELQARLQETESRLEAEARRARAAEADNAELLNAMQQVIAATPETTAVGGPLTHAIVQARFSQAVALARHGDPAVALRELLWCFDEGMARVSTFRVARRRALLDEIARLGERHPAALAALRDRRDRAEVNMLGHAYELDLVQDFAALNRVLHDEAVTLARFDELPADDPRRQALEHAAYEQFISARRYADAARSRSWQRMSSEFDDLAKEPDFPKDSPDREANLKSSREYAVNTALNSIETLAGAGDLEHARELTRRLLAFDGSPGVREKVRERLARAGQVTLLNEASAN